MEEAKLKIVNRKIVEQKYPSAVIEKKKMSYSSPVISILITDDEWHKEFMNRFYKSTATQIVKAANLSHLLYEITSECFIGIRYVPG